MKQELAQWMSLVFHKSLTMQNIQPEASFRPTSIQLLNKDAMVGKMDASEVF